jgi:S1-C subfamily serine protease/DNA-directed RNA polymerase subunit RPC12/RpoP
MQIEFNCPQCGLTMQASIESTGGTAECPQCGNQFVVEAEVPQVQVVKARAIPAPGHQAPQAHAHGHGPGHAHPQPPRRAGHPAPVSPQVFAERARAAAAAKESQRLFIGLGVAAVLLVGVVVWLNVQGKKVTAPPPPAVIEAGALDIAVPPPKADSPEELEKKRIAADLESARKALAAKNTLEDEKAKEEANMKAALREEVYAEKDEQQREFRDYLKSVFFNGDSAATDAYLKIWDDVMWGVSNLMTDSDKSNDLKSEEEYHAYLAQRMGERFVKNAVLSEWLKTNGREPGKFIQELVQVDPKNPRSAATGAMAAKKFDFSKYMGSGSGFWISADGWLLSNQHVVGDAKVVDLHLGDEKIIQAKVVKTDMAMDLALLKAEYKPDAWQAISKGATDLALGRTVFTVGYPNPEVQGVEAKFTDGRISATSGIGDRKDSYQISVPVQHGNSGGALVDFETGWVVGVVNAKLESRSGVSADNVSYAIKGNVVSTFFESVPEAKTAAAKLAPKPVTKGDEQGAIARAKKSSVLILRRR